MLTSLSGNVVKRWEGKAEEASCMVDVNDVPVGSYLLQVRQDGEVYAATVIKCAD